MSCVQYTNFALLSREFQLDAISSGSLCLPGHIPLAIAGCLLQHIGVPHPCLLKQLGRRCGSEIKNVTCNLCIMREGACNKQRLFQRLHQAVQQRAVESCAVRTCEHSPQYPPQPLSASSLTSGTIVFTNWAVAISMTPHAIGVQVPALEFAMDSCSVNPVLVVLLVQPARLAAECCLQTHTNLPTCFVAGQDRSTRWGGGVCILLPSRSYLHLAPLSDIRRTNNGQHLPSSNLAKLMVGTWSTPFAIYT